MTSRELAERAVRATRDDTLAEVSRERSLLLRFAANRPTQATAIDDVTLELAVLRHGHVGRATTNRTDDESLAVCAARATLAAEAASQSGTGTYPGFPECGAAGGAALPPAFDADTAKLDPGTGGEALRAVFAVAEQAGVDAHGIWTAAETERAVATAGFCAHERTTDAYTKVICIAPDGRSGFASAMGSALARLEPAELAQRAAAKATLDGEPVELRASDYPVVMEAAAVGTLLDLLAETALNGLVHAEGRGALAEQIGSQVAAPSVNLADSPSHGLTLPRAFDAEGTPKRPLPLIQDGVAKNVAHDRRSAALAGVESTGHALSAGGDPFGAVPMNLVLAGGGAPGLDELCAPIERGVYVTRLWYANVARPKETLMTAVTRDGTFLIEDGKVSRPLRDMRLTDSVLGMLTRVEALGARQELTGDAEFYRRRLAYGSVCPSLRISSARFSSAAG